MSNFSDEVLAREREDLEEFGHIGFDASTCLGLIVDIQEARARVAQLEAALKDARPYLVSACHFQEDASATDIIFDIDDALKAAPK